MAKFLTFGAAAAAGAALQSFVRSNQQAAECKPMSAFSTKYTPYVLGEVLNLAEDVAVFRFLLNNPDDEFSLVPCSTLQAHFKQGTNIVDQPMRFYTPITSNGTKGYFDLLVKKQRPGRFTEHLFGMDVGETLLFRVVQYKLAYRKDRWANVGLIAGGTGLCPILQFLNASLETPGDKTQLTMLFANRSENKILLKGMLDAKAKQFKDRFRVFYIVDKLDDPNAKCNPAYVKKLNFTIDRDAQPDTDESGAKLFHGYQGYIDTPLLKTLMPAPADDTLILVCGPDPMMVRVCGSSPLVLRAMSSGQAYQPTGSVLNNAADVGGFLGDLGYTKDMVYRF